MATSKIVNHIIDVAHGGTGGTSANAARVNLGVEKSAGSSSTDTWSSIMEWCGQISGDGKIVAFTMYTKGAYINNISSITVKSCNIVMRGVKGYIDNISSYTEFVGKSGFTVAATKTGMNCFRITITKSSAMENITNNTPVTISGKMTIQYNP